MLADSAGNGSSRMTNDLAVQNGLEWTFNRQYVQWLANEVDCLFGNTGTALHGLKCTRSTVLPPSRTVGPATLRYHLHPAIIQISASGQQGCAWLHLFAMFNIYDVSREQFGQGASYHIHLLLVVGFLSLLPQSCLIKFSHHYHLAAEWLLLFLLPRQQLTYACQGRGGGKPSTFFWALESAKCVNYAHIHGLVMTVHGYLNVASLQAVGALILPQTAQARAWAGSQVWAAGRQPAASTEAMHYAGRFKLTREGVMHVSSEHTMYYLSSRPLILCFLQECVPNVVFALHQYMLAEQIHSH